MIDAARVRELDCRLFTQHALNQRLKRRRSLREKGGADKMKEEREASKDGEASEEIGAAETGDERSDDG